MDSTKSGDPNVRPWPDHAHLAQPPSPEPAPPVTDAEVLEDWPKQCESVTASWRMSRLLADRARAQKRIVALQARIEMRSRERHSQHRLTVTMPLWDKCPEELCMADCALLAQEVPDAD